jgi:hypothetical protein
LDSRGGGAGRAACDLSTQAWRQYTPGGYCELPAR